MPQGALADAGPPAPAGRRAAGVGEKPYDGARQCSFSVLIGVMNVPGDHVSRWTPERVEAAGRFMINRIQADFGPATGVAEVLAVRMDPTWATGGEWPEGRQDGDPTEPGDAVVTLLGGRHEVAAHLDEGVEYACWAVAEQLRGSVIDDLSRPWPELADGEGKPIGVLEPQFEPLMMAHWAFHGAPFCAMGQLHEAVAAAGFQLASD
jgi:hypothetical protein